MRALVSELKAFAEVLMEQIGPLPDNFEQIVQDAIEKLPEELRKAKEGS